jgi:hypothetical protein
MECHVKPDFEIVMPYQIWLGVAIEAPNNDRLGGLAH